MQVVEHRPSCRGVWAQSLQGMRDLSGSGIKPVSPALAGGFLTTEPPMKAPQNGIFKAVYDVISVKMHRSLKQTYKIQNIIKMSLGTSLVAQWFKNPPAKAEDISSTPGPKRFYMLGAAKPLHHSY